MAAAVFFALVGGTEVAAGVADKTDEPVAAELAAEPATSDPALETTTSTTTSTTTTAPTTTAAATPDSTAAPTTSSAATADPEGPSPDQPPVTQASPEAPAETTVDLPAPAQPSVVAAALDPALLEEASISVAVADSAGESGSPVPATIPIGSARTIRYLVRNTGPVALTRLSIEITTEDGTNGISDLECSPQGTPIDALLVVFGDLVLEPGEQLECTALARPDALSWTASTLAEVSADVAGSEGVAPVFASAGYAARAAAVGTPLLVVSTRIPGASGRGRTREFPALVDAAAVPDGLAVDAVVHNGGNVALYGLDVRDLLVEGVGHSTVQYCEVRGVQVTTTPFAAELAPGDSVVCRIAVNGLAWNATHASRVSAIATTADGSAVKHVDTRYLQTPRMPRMEVFPTVWTNLSSTDVARSPGSRVEPGTSETAFIEVGYFGEPMIDWSVELSDGTDAWGSTSCADQPEILAGDTWLTCRADLTAPDSPCTPLEPTLLVRGTGLWTGRQLDSVTPYYFHTTCDFMVGIDEGYHDFGVNVDGAVIEVPAWSILMELPMSVTRRVTNHGTEPLYDVMVSMSLDGAPTEPCPVGPTAWCPTRIRSRARSWRHGDGPMTCFARSASPPWGSARPSRSW